MTDIKQPPPGEELPQGCSVEVEPEQAAGSRRFSRSFRRFPPTASNPSPETTPFFTGRITQGEVPSDQVLELTAIDPPEKAFAVPSVRLRFAAKEETQRVARLALALDSIGAATLPLLVEGTGAECTGLDEGDNILAALSVASLFPTLESFILGGSATALIGLAAGEVEKTYTGDEMPEVNTDFISMLASRHYLEPAVIQTLREIRSSGELLQVLSRRRLGWLFDEICRMACLEIRKRFDHPATIEAIAFGTSGAVLGRASIEPGNFSL